MSVENRTELQTQLIETVFSLSRLWEYFLNTYMEADFSFQQFLLMATIHRNFDRPPRLTEVADKMVMSHQNVKKLAAQLEKCGFVTLKRDNDDRRVSRIHFTPFYYSYWENRTEADAERLERLFGKVTDAQLATLHNKLKPLVDSAAMFRKRYSPDKSHSAFPFQSA